MRAPTVARGRGNGTGRLFPGWEGDGPIAATNANHLVCHDTAGASERAKKGARRLHHPAEGLGRIHMKKTMGTINLEPKGMR